MQDAVNSEPPSVTQSDGDCNITNAEWRQSTSLSKPELNVVRDSKQQSSQKTDTAMSSVNSYAEHKSVREMTSTLSQKTNKTDQQKSDDKPCTSRMSVSNNERNSNSMERSISPELLLRKLPQGDGNWLNECTAEALNNLLQTLKIDPQLLDSDPPKNTVPQLKDFRPTLTALQSVNEGKLNLHSHRLSTCSV